MLSKTQVKYIQSLFHKKFREEYGQYVVEGAKMADEAIKLSPHDIINIYALNNWIISQPALVNDLKQKLVEISPADMERISALNSPSEVLVILKQRHYSLPETWDGLTLLLDGIQDPGNLGTIIRTADWFGVRNIVCGLGTADYLNPKVIQSTMGSIFRMHIYYEELNSFLQTRDKIPLLATSLGGQPLEKNEKWEKAFILIGNESKGIQPSLMAKATRKILIPGQGGAESLNAAVATGIILYSVAKRD